MDRQSMQRGAGSAAVQEFCYVGGGQPEVAGGAFLMELLEEDDTAAADHPPENVDDRLSRVMRSLEAEIGGGGTPASPATACDVESAADGPTSDDGGLEDMLSDFDSCPGTCSETPAAAAVPFEYWAEVPLPAVGHDMGGWYVDGEGAVVGCEFREQYYYTHGEGSAVEQVYSPLWE